MNPLKTVSLLVLLAVLVGAFFYVENIGKTKKENESLQETVRGEQQRQEIDHENKSLERSNIIRLLDNDGWLRQYE